MKHKFYTRGLIFLSNSLKFLIIFRQSWTKILGFFPSPRFPMLVYKYFRSSQQCTPKTNFQYTKVTTLGKGGGGFPRMRSYPLGVAPVIRGVVSWGSVAVFNARRWKKTRKFHRFFFNCWSAVTSFHFNN